MEVHHPHHLTQRKKWGEYLLEFLMIFLAVFMGFIAENWRESLGERKKEKQFMRSLLIDLQKDVRSITQINKSRLLRLSRSDTLMNLLIESTKSETNGELIYYYARNVSYVTNFQVNNGSFDQLKSGSGLRLIHSKPVTDSIESYYFASALLEKIMELEGEEQIAYRELFSDLFDVKVFLSMFRQRDDLTVYMPSGNPKLLSYDKNLINKFCMKLHLWQKQSSSVCSRMDRLKEKAQNLINLIQKEYHLE